MRMRLREDDFAGETFAGSGHLKERWDAYCVGMSNGG